MPRRARAILAAMTRPLPRLFFLAVTVAALAAAPARADDGPEALRYFEQREQAVLKECGAKFWDAAKGARRQGA